ncbi:cAMP-dependent protein kinase catalytic subunit PRKX-like [Eleutherodactylus coqui]|uniref:cAMP-dependent protein kinase catalytic subunit PRKX-like n=1 Tax=Eleutherodactylus coqui TaxID=57060 RepID=UPI00346283FF
MKAIKKRNHLEEEAEKIEEVPEEKKDGADDGQDKPTKANWFLECLGKFWARFAGCFRSCICIQKEGSYEELQELIGISKKDNKEESNMINANEERESGCRPEKPTTNNTCLEEPDQPGEERSGTVPLSLESFTFHRKLGAGAFGEVFLARNHIRKEYVAIKASEKFNTQWSSCNNIECGILQLSYRSPYLIHGLAAFHTLNYAYFVMELAPGGDLYHFLRNKFPLDSTTIKFIMAEVICGTQFLHKENIIHRDLKPENVLLTADGHVKITDFGLAAVRVSIRTKLRCRGTPGFAAPEMLWGNEYGREVDYFAIGAILYILCTGKTPFPGYCNSDIEYSVLCRKPHYPRSLNRVTRNILKGLLCKNPFTRLGRRKDVKHHPFFKGTNWKDVEARRVVPPAIMITQSVDLNSNETLDYAEKPNREVTVDQKVYDRFSFVCQEWSRHYHPVISETTA